MYGYDSRVRLSEVDQDRRMTLNAILNSFQDCSSFHSEDLGVGAAFVEQKKRMWVLSSWKIVIQIYPELAEYILKGVTEGWSYDILKARMNIPCCKDVYYTAYRRFFWLLNKARE